MMWCIEAKLDGEWHIDASGLGEMAATKLFESRKDMPGEYRLVKVTKVEKRETIDETSKKEAKKAPTPKKEAAKKPAPKKAEKKTGLVEKMKKSVSKKKS